MNEHLSTSLIVTTYNWPEALNITLNSVLNQSVNADEIIVADDGSGPETAQVVKKVLAPSGARWCHVWQHDRGVRQSRIKNVAVKYADARYLIFVDHDVVLHPNFIADHLAMAEGGIFLQGKRSLLPGYYTAEVLATGFFKPPSVWSAGLRNRKNAVRIPWLGRVLSRDRGFETSLRGCNLSLFKQDFLGVDGFDEVFDQSWGREDSDFCYRLFHSGLRVRNLWFLALQYHLNHGSVENWDRDRLDGEIQRNLEEKRIKALKGFSTLSAEGEVIAASGNF
ncbi:MAG: glycosyltransferase [Syntrophaceae bacterium]|nr:glycosyltransferase [Syntrophaceae bacterium]